MVSQPIRVALDLETTGLLAEQDSIIEVGAIKFAGDETLETFECFVAPRHTLPYRIQRLTGIRPSDLAGAPALADVAPDLRAFLGDYPLVGHSITFDAAFLRRVGLARRNPLVDTYELASALLPDLPSYTLESVGAALGLASPIHHRALADAMLARDVFLALLERLHALDTTTLQTLERLTTGRDWTPAYFVRATLRTRGDRASGTLGDQLAAKLGLDPAVLGLAVAREAPPQVVPAIAPHGGMAADEAPAAANLVTECFNEGGSALIEVRPDAGAYAACLRALCAWVARTGEAALVVAADAAAVARVARARIPEALSQLGMERGALPVAEVLEQNAYLCLHRWFGAATLPRNGELPQELARGLAKLAVWSSGTTSGSRAEVALTGQELVAWERARAGHEFADSTPRCAYRQRGYCFAARAEETARAARIVVTTHAALAAELAGHTHRLPTATRVLILEAHLLEDELRRAGSWAVERRDLAALLAGLGETDSHGARGGLFHLAARHDKSAREASWLPQVARAQAAGAAFFAALSHLHAAAQRGGDEAHIRGDAPDQALPLDDGARQMESWGDVERAWDALEARLRTVAKLASDVAKRLAPSGRGVDGVETDLLAARRSLEELCDRLRGVIETEHQGMIAWLRLTHAPAARPAANGAAPSGANAANGPHDTKGKPAEAGATPGAAQGETPALHVAPVEVGGMLAPLLAPHHALVLAGTALAAGGEFDFVSAGLGLPPTTQTLAQAPDYSGQTLLLLPEDAPEPNAPAFQRHLDDLIVSVAGALQGRTVVIFPSHAALRAAAMGIKRTLEGHDVLVLAQGMDGSARQLWQTFRTQPRVVLLGAGAFWDGGEREGMAPACVIVARLPFPSLSDPLLAARAETWLDQQAQFVVPHAALRVRQALNGLVWGQHARAAVILFDRRISTRSYGATLLATLPRCTQRTEPLSQLAASVAAWVDEHIAGRDL